MLLECREVILRRFKEMHRLFGQQLYPKRTDCAGLPSAAGKSADFGRTDGGCCRVS